MPNVKKIPFDSLTLAAVVCELQPLVGGKLQRIVQPSERNITLGIYAGGKERFVHFSCSPVFARVHLATVMPASQGEQPPLGAAMRRLVEGARITAIKQIGFDRQMEIRLARQEGEYRLIAELTGKHSNLILVQPAGTVAAAAHHVSTRQSVRAILPGKPYERPPFPPRRPVFQAKNAEEMKEAEGASPFLMQLIEAGGGRLDEIGAAVSECQFEPVAVEGLGAYPVSVAALGLEEHRVDSVSQALEKHFRTLEENAEREAIRARLLTPLRRVLLAREVALADLEQAQDTARRAGELQLKGELILAYAHSLEEGAKKLETQDYEGNPLSIPLDPESSPLENAQRFFDKAKRAKARAEHVHDQIDRIRNDRLSLLGLIRRAEDATTGHELLDLEEQAKSRRWLHETRLPGKAEQEKPYEGHRIRERLGPGGIRVLFGENATSNDYLTLRVARPNDIWMHVRGGVSAHVVIVTNNKPERIGPEALRFAAQIAVQNSVSKHSSYVPVDYTLKKHVRKPRGAKAGAALYTHEKTLHVEPQER